MNICRETYPDTHQEGHVHFCKYPESHPLAHECAICLGSWSKPYEEED